jgi:hypothetical protein
MKALFKAFLPFFLVCNLSLANTVDLSQQFVGANLGQGVHGQKGELTPFSCTVIDDVLVHHNSNFLLKSDYIEIETFEEVKKLSSSGLQISDFFQSKLEKSLTRSNKDKVIKMELSFLQKQEFKSNARLKEKFEFLVRNSLFVEFFHACGSHYLSSIAKGHKLHIFMIVSSSEEQSKKEFETILNLKLNELISKVTGSESVTEVLGKLELTTSMLKNLEKLSQKIQVEYTIAMTSSVSNPSQSRLLMPSEAPILSGISDQISQTGNNLTKLLLTLTKSFPEFALNEFENNLTGLPQIEGISEPYINLLSTNFMGEELFTLEEEKLFKFMQSNQDFHFFASAFDKILNRKEKIEVLLSKANKVHNTIKLKFKRKKKLDEIIKLLKLNISSATNMQNFCTSSSLVYADCYALAFGKSPGKKVVKEKFIQAGNDFACLELNDIPAIENCLNQGMGPKSCKRIEFTKYSTVKGICVKSQIDFLEDFLLPVQPKMF